MDSSFGTNNILWSLFIIKVNVSGAQINRFPRVLRVHFLLVPKTVTLPEHLFSKTRWRTLLRNAQCKCRERNKRARLHYIPVKSRCRFVRTNKQQKFAVASRMRMFRKIARIPRNSLKDEKSEFQWLRKKIKCCNYWKSKVQPYYTYSRRMCVQF